MKLKCEKHQRRVVVVDGVVIHRNGDGDKCSTPALTIGSRIYNPIEVNEYMFPINRGLSVNLEKLLTKAAK